MTRISRRGISILDGTETAVATARVAMGSATRPAFRSMKGQVVPALARFRKLNG